MAQTKRARLPRCRRLVPRTELIEDRVLLSIFTVTSTGDNGGVDPAPFAGTGTLRQAIIDSNATSGLNTIGFAITTGSAPYAINVQSALPQISNSVVINGESQPGYAGTPIIEINGGGNTGDGLVLAQGSDGSTIEGLDIVNFPDGSFTDGAGIHVQSSNNLIVSNFLGPDPSGKTASAGNYFGVFIDGVYQNGASNNTIGGVGSLGNLMSGNLFDGVLIWDETTDTPPPAQGNLVIGNKIGTDVTGTAALPNQGNGIDIFASYDTIGGAGSGQGNLISANAGAGINLSTGGISLADNVVQGNYIGTDITGKVALGNAAQGVSDNSDSGNTIGGTAAGAGNLISGNGIPHLSGGGIALTGVSDDLIAGNIIGTTAGTITQAPGILQPLGNVGDGILLTGSSTNNTIGGPATGAGNLIAASGSNGIEIFASDFNLVSGNAIGMSLFTGNEIGIGPLVTLGNQVDGISLVGSSGNTIGGATQFSAPGQISALGGNVVSGNGQDGIAISVNDTSGIGNLVIGNLIGTRAIGDLVVANGQDGISLGSTTANTIGGANVLNSDGSISILLGNVVSGNAQVGILLNQPTATDNLILGNRIGTDLAGARALPNGEQGVLINFGSSNNTIGSANLDGSSANVISGNTQSGIEIQDTSTANVVLGNRVGLTAAGTATLPNLGDGVLLSASGNTIGGASPGAGNLISGNLGAGVRISSADKSAVLGNDIGVNVNGVSSGVGNVQSGIVLDSTIRTTIGGVTASPGSGAGNIISGNRQAGIELTNFTVFTTIQGNVIGLNADGTAGQGNLLSGIVLDAVAANTIGGSQAGAGNVLSNNGVSGLEIEQGSNTTVQGNFIGTDPTGTVARGNLQNGLIVSGSTGNTIAGNVLSGNNLTGLVLSGAGTSGNLATGNLIGTDRSGTLALGNGSSGVLLDSAVGNTIGGITAGAGNVISANRAQGIEISGTTAAPAQNNAVMGNLIGTSSSGTAPLGNAQDGVFLSTGAGGNTIGGSPTGARNVISANQANGVELFAGASGNEVAGNLIGTDVTGEVALGNNNVGVAINSAGGNTIGGVTTVAGQGAGNVISGNRSSGVLISGTASSGNQVEGNLIGTDATGSRALPNSSSGVTIDSAPGNLIGGDVRGAGNIIAANRTFGVLVLGETATGNRIAGNLIGTSSAGSSALGNALDGVVINAAPGNTIGGLTAPSHNVISGNAGNGINVLNITDNGGIAILGNFIGTDPNGLHGVGNGLDGIVLNGVQGTLIAGAGAPNLISGNAGNGIHVLGASATGTVIEGSRIGTNLLGTAAIANRGDGIFLDNSGAATIGGLTAGQANLISGNGANGVEVSGASGTVIVGSTLGTDAAGGSALPNGGYGVSLESTANALIQSALISGNTLGGVQITGYGVGNNRIYGSIIGTDRTGEASLSNGLASLNNGVGVFINGSAGNLVGGTGPGQGNLISGNSLVGVYIFGRFAAGNTVAGNLVGTDATGTRPIFATGGSPIQQVGVLINQAPGLDIQDVNPGAGNTIGGTTPGALNVISGNLVGIEISGNDARGNVVAGNLIGPGASGAAGAGNTVGVYINGAPGNVIGGGSGNVISGNTSVGVYILGSTSTGNTVAGNLIGVGPDGLSRLPNQTGVYIENAPGNVIGGATSSSRNVISANTIAGVYILAGQSVGNVVESNLMGFAANGVTRLGNREYGVLLYNAANNSVPQRGPVGNRIVASGIANYREFTGRAATANPPGGQSSRQRSSGHRRVKVRLVTGSPTPRGPMQRKRGRLV